MTTKIENINLDMGYETVKVERITRETFERAAVKVGGRKTSKTYNWFDSLPFNSYYRIAHPSGSKCGKRDGSNSNCSFMSHMYGVSRRLNVGIRMIHETNESLLIYKFKQDKK